MIIAKPEWFSRRKYTGWGVSIRTWQGAVYLAGVMAALPILLYIFSWSTEAMITVTVIWLVFLLVDMVDVMRNLKKDEREATHEAIAERNAAWGMMLVLVIGLFVELLYYALQQKIYFDPVIVIALAVGVIAKSVTNYQLERRN
ncbi:MAG TPA: hypothetical protein PKI66_06450 [Methanobacteriaceae archaeon]|nr:hypothetical protein [Methanobacteriaceae archaeon]